MSLAVILSAHLRMVADRTVRLETAERMPSGLLCPRRVLRHVPIDERGHGIPYVPHPGGVQVLRWNGAERIFGCGLEPPGQGWLAALVHQPIHPHRCISSPAKLEMVACNRMAEQLAFPNL